jgi:hypothetical protein
MANYREGILEKIGDGFRYGALDIAYVVGDARHEKTRGVFCEKSQGLLLYFVIKFVSHIGDNPLADRIHQNGLAVNAAALDKKSQNDG